MFLDFLIDSLRNYPKGTLLITIAFINLFAVFYVVLSKKKYKSALFKAYLFYSFFALLWVISNAYFQSKFLFAFSPAIAKYMAIAANITGSFSIIGFYCFASIAKDPKKIMTSFVAKVTTILLAITLIFNLIPGLTIQGVKIFPESAAGAKFELIFGPWNSVYFLIGLVALIAAFTNFIRAIKNARDRIENMSLYYILFGMSLMYGSLALFIIILPQIFSNYDYVWIPPLLNIAHIIIVGYAIIVRRFIDIRLLVSKFIKLLFSFGVSFAVTFLIVKTCYFFFDKDAWQYFMIIGTGMAIIVFNKTFRFLNSYRFYNYFGATDTEHFRQISRDLRAKEMIYTSVKECSEDLQKIFTTKNKKIVPRIIAIDAVTRRKYPKLISYFKQNKSVLVTEEIKFIEAQKDEIIPFLKELEALGGVCIPLYHPSKGLVGFFVLGEKSYNHIYTKEEIQALEDIGAYLSFVITGIIYNSELEAEVSRKTTNLKNKIREIKELLRQQSDFIAVTAHEFRTPLSIALFQIEDILTNRDKFKQSPAIAENLKVIDEALDNLKVLTQKLFTVQRYDLNKVPLHKEKIDIKDFIKGIYQDFYILMKEKSLVFKLSQKLDKKTFLDIDKAQIRQVMQNLLTNAYKFTPDGGKVILSTEKDGHNVIIKISDDGKGVPDNMKKTIFDKFRTNNNASGIGLGLYIAKKIVELHKGKIWAQDSEMGGAEFCVSLGD